MNRTDFFAKWSALHGNAEIKGIVKTWLIISYGSAKFISVLRITPNLLTLLGIIFAIAMAANPLSIWTIPLLVLSLYADGIDGSVAIYQNRASRFGAVLDSVADRISEALWFYALYAIGVPAWIPITLWSVAAFQEYARAKLISLGVSDIGVVTPAERPVRASFLFIVLILNQLSLPGATALSIAFLAVQIYSFVSVVRFSRSQLLQ